MPHAPPSNAELIAKLREKLPFSACVTKHANSARDSGRGRLVRPKQRIEIAKILDGGDNGGIVCMARVRGANAVLAISITHLRFDMRHPLYKEVRAYQLNRIKSLARAGLHNGRQGAK